jgi:hypothetical protein
MCRVGDCDDKQHKHVCLPSLARTFLACRCRRRLKVLASSCNTVGHSASSDECVHPNLPCFLVTPAGKLSRRRGPATRPRHLRAAGQRLAAAALWAPRVLLLLLLASCLAQAPGPVAHQTARSRQRNGERW